MNVVELTQEQIAALVARVAELEGIVKSMAECLTWCQG